jgi:hypothetical protein
MRFGQPTKSEGFGILDKTIPMSSSLGQLRCICKCLLYVKAKISRNAHSDHVQVDVAS